MIVPVIIHGMNQILTASIESCPRSGSRHRTRFGIPPKIRRSPGGISAALPITKRWQKLPAAAQRTLWCRSV